MILLLRLAAQHPEEYKKIKYLVNRAALDKHTEVLLRHMDVFENNVNLDDLRGLVKQEKDQEILGRLIDLMEKPVDQGVIAAVSNQLISSGIASRLTKLLIKYEDGEDIDIVYEIEQMIKVAPSKVMTTEFVSLDDAANDTAVLGVYRWHLDCLNDCMRMLASGDDIIVAARPDAGKTTFLANLVTCVMRQSEGIIVWFNNESKASRIYRRCVQSGLLLNDNEFFAKSRSGEVQDNWNTIFGHDRLRIYDVHGMSCADLEAILDTQKENIVMILFDMLDNVKSNSVGKNAREDQILEERYKWAREMGVKYDSVILKTSQLSAEAEGVMYPNQSMLKDCKTGKVAATDVLILLGMSADPALRTIRFLSAPKNKLAKPGSKPLRAEVKIDGDRAVYLD